jgi:DNA-3-methyladenine glycosylase I
MGHAPKKPKREVARPVLEPITSERAGDAQLRCPWCLSSTRMIEYHDREWGVPAHDDRKLFEYLVLDAFQAGLSWAIVLKKREGFRRAFAGFSPDDVADFSADRVEQLRLDPSIIRNRQKIEATVRNARAFLDVQERHGSFDTYIWQFVDGTPQQNRWPTQDRLPAKTPTSDAMSRALRADGFSFVGSTICYAFMQAAGMVNDHLVGCFRWRALGGL